VSDELYGLTRDDKAIFQQMVGQTIRTLQPLPKVKRRQYPSGRGVTNITFIIVSAGATTCLGKVISWDAGYVLNDVPGDINHLAGISTPIGVVQICDAKGCVFDEPPDQLFGRIGTATYRSVNTAGVCRSGYGPWPPVWEADTLCCKKPTCAFLGGT